MCIHQSVFTFTSCWKLNKFSCVTFCVNKTDNLYYKYLPSLTQVLLKCKNFSILRVITRKLRLSIKCKRVFSSILIIETHSNVNAIFRIENRFTFGQYVYLNIESICFRELIKQICFMRRS